jgi:pseudaminic acid cytidylyltransferase
MSVTVVIPARGGSKRIPRKNVKPFCGTPALQRVIETCKRASVVDRIIVSTEDIEIAEKARIWGAEVPSLRAADLAGDFTSTQAVIKAAISDYEIPNDEILICVYPTAVGLLTDDLSRMASANFPNGTTYAVTVTEIMQSPLRSFKLGPSGTGLFPLFPENMELRSQELPPVFSDAGMAYGAKASTWLLDENIFSDLSQPITIPTHRGWDINTEIDWRIAELLFSADEDKEIS